MAREISATLLADGSVRPADSRAEILRVARELFVAQGFAATTTRELAEGLGFTKAALYYHFRTKDDLLSALAEPIIERLRTLVTQTPLRATASGRRALLAAYIDVAAADLDLIRVLTQDPSVTRRPATAEHAALSERMLQLLSGRSEPDTTQRARARAALGAIRAALVQADPDDDPRLIRTAALAAGCGALGIAEPAHPARPSLALGTALAD